jgi:YaiO family outer membrane protein
MKMTHIKTHIKTHAIVIWLLCLVFMGAVDVFPGIEEGKADARTEALELIQTAKARRQRQDFRGALDMLNRAFALTGDKQVKASATLETAYVKFLRGDGYNIYKRDIQAAFDLHTGIAVGVEYDEGFKRVFWEVREQKTGAPAPPPPPETYNYPGRKMPGLPPTDTAPEDRMKKNRLDFQYIYEYLAPHDEYGAWETYYIKYYRYEKPTFNFFVHGGMVKRDGKNDYIGLLGFSKDWNSRLYTYTVVAKGTVSTYLPNGRFDHDFNFKLGSRANWLWTVGVTYIKYYVPAEDFIISTGLALYLERWVLAYRLFWNHKYPGDIRSFTHLGSVETGIDKSRWTAFSVSWGSQAYLALYVLVPEKIRQDAFNINIVHRQWLTRGVGIFGQAGYLDLKDEYRKYLLSIGLFLEF